MTNKEFIDQLHKYHIEDAERQYIEFQQNNDDGTCLKLEYDTEDFDKMATMFESRKDCNIADNAVWNDVISEYITNNLNKHGDSAFKNYVTDNGEYIIPVSWHVYSSVVVKGVKNAYEAIKLLQDNLADIPLSTEPVYVEDSYTLDFQDISDIEIAQEYDTSDSVIVHKTGDRIVMEKQ